MDETENQTPIHNLTPDVNFISVQSHLGWHEYFMLQAMLASYKSKDPNTKVGCVFVDKDNHQLTMGYNGFVAGIDETKVPWGNDKSVPLEFSKYPYVLHAEANAILHRNASLQGSTGYVTLFPCNECAKMMAAQRISRIFYLSDKYAHTPEIRVSKKILELSGVEYAEMSLSKDRLTHLTEYLTELMPTSSEKL